MKKSELISKSICDSISNNIDINVQKILDDGVEFDNSPAIISCIMCLINDINSGKIKDIECNIENDNSQQTAENIFHCFVVALVEIDPVDFEGNDPLDVKMLMETTSEYIYDSIDNGQIIGLSISK